MPRARCARPVFAQQSKGRGELEKEGLDVRKRKDDKIPFLLRVKRDRAQALHTPRAASRPERRGGADQKKGRKKSLSKRKKPREKKEENLLSFSNEGAGRSALGQEA